MFESTHEILAIAGGEDSVDEYSGDEDSDAGWTTGNGTDIAGGENTGGGAESDVDEDSRVGGNVGVDEGGEGDDNTGGVTKSEDSDVGEDSAGWEDSFITLDSDCEEACTSDDASVASFILFFNTSDTKSTEGCS